jgi:pilus assembly protein CpaC
MYSKIKNTRAKTWSLLALLSVSYFTPVFADDPVPSATVAPTPAASPSQNTAQNTGEGEVSAKAAKRSRLTNDASELNADKRRLLLTTGEDKAVDLDFDVSTANGIATGNAKVVFPQLVKIGDKRQIVFKPLSEGTTTVSIRDQDGNLRLIFRVRVTKNNLLTIASEIRDLLRDVEGIDIRIVGQRVVIEGEVLVPADYARLLAVIQDNTYQPWIINMTSLSNLALQVIAKKIQEDINVFAPNVKTRVVNNRIFLEGSVDSKAVGDNAERIALLYIPDPRPLDPLSELDQKAQHLTPPRSIVQTFIVVNPPPPKKQEKLVRVTVHFVELSKDYNKLFAFKWEPSFTSDPQIAIGQANGTTGASGASFSATISSLLPKLQTAESAGYARVLRTGTLIVRSGQPALLTDRTEIPYTQTSSGQTTGATAKVGLSIGVTPLILGQSEDIQMEIKMNQSSVLTRAPAGGAPTVADHVIETKIYVKSNESAAVAAVTSSDVGTDFNKDDPQSGSYDQSNGTGTDALFTLLHSKNYRKTKTQFVIFITPQILDNASEGTDDLKKNFRIKVR